MLYSPVSVVLRLRLVSGGLRATGNGDQRRPIWTREARGGLYSVHCMHTVYKSNIFTH